jgi:proteasome alpha subunit
MRRAFRAGLALGEALTVAVAALASVGGVDGAPRSLPAGQLEVAVLDRNRGSRKFKRLSGPGLIELLPVDHGEPPSRPAPADTPPHDEDGDAASE